MTNPFALETRSPEETQELGRRLGAMTEVGDLYLLQGPLGSGKTTLAQGIAWGAGVTGYAHSPTFVLVHEYAGRIPLYHVDLYRLDLGDIEVDDLGIHEMLADGACMVEWGEKAGAVLPADSLRIHLEFGPGAEDRRIALVPSGPRYETLVQELQAAAAR